MRGWSSLSEQPHLWQFHEFVCMATNNKYSHRQKNAAINRCHTSFPVFSVVFSLLCAHLSRMQTEKNKCFIEPNSWSDQIHYIALRYLSPNCWFISANQIFLGIIMIMVLLKQVEILPSADIKSRVSKSSQCIHRLHLKELNSMVVRFASTRLSTWRQLWASCWE